MIYKSTRGGGSCTDVQAVLRGPAPDGGLYIPSDMEKIKVDVRACLAMKYDEMAAAIISAFLPGFENMPELVRLAYTARFDTDEVTPLVPLGEDWLLELFHGPTSAFKDVALSMLPRLMTAARQQEGISGETVILTATSGDTGKAALEGFHDVEGTRIIVFYPDGGVSPIQRTQMVTQEGKNVCVSAVRGNFDDCQSAVKTAFNKINAEGLLNGSGKALTSANSINIGRLVPQVVYYFAAYASLMKSGDISFGDRVDYVVPTGNFGDILAGYYAKLLGLPVGKLVCASNANRVLTDFLETGCYDVGREFIKSTSPSMDVLISSNLERLIYLKSGGDTELVASCMEQLKTQGSYKIPENVLKNIRADFEAGCCDDEDTKDTIRRVWEREGYLCDPHTAVALRVCEQYKARREGNAPVVVLSTASPYKFPATVLSALGAKSEGNEFEQIEALNKLTFAPVPQKLAALQGKAERFSEVIAREEILPYILRKLGVEK